MSLREQLQSALAEYGVNHVSINKDAVYHGEPAIEVTAYWPNRRYVVGTFTTNVKGMPSGFGGEPKDIVALMLSKCKAMWEGHT